MEKQKLIEIRKKRGFSQKQIADHLCMDVSNYNRREKGMVKITPTEWKKLADILNIPIGEIFESEDVFFSNKDVSIVNHGDNESHKIPLYILENQQKYIQKLENEIQQLKEKNNE